MSADWYYLIDGQKFGPVRENELKALANVGEIGPDNHVWKEGFPSWVEASRIAGLFLQEIPALAENTIRHADNYDDTRTRNEWHPQRLALLAFGFMGVASCFMPWVRAPIIGSVIGVSGADGWVAVGLFVPIILIAMNGRTRLPVVDIHRFGATLFAALAIWFGVEKLRHVHEIKNPDAGNLNNPFRDILAVAIQPGVGLYLLSFAGAAIMFSLWVVGFPRHHRRSYR